MAATRDIIETSLRYLQSPVSPIATLSFMKEDLGPPAEAWTIAGTGAGAILSEEAVFSHVLPAFETVFMGRDMHRFASFSGLCISWLTNSLGQIAVIRAQPGLAL